MHTHISQLFQAALYSQFCLAHHSRICLQVHRGSSYFFTFPYSFASLEAQLLHRGPCNPSAAGTSGKASSNYSFTVQWSETSL